MTLNKYCYSYNKVCLDTLTGVDNYKCLTISHAQQHLQECWGITMIQTCWVSLFICIKSTVLLTVCMHRALVTIDDCLSCTPVFHVAVIILLREHSVDKNIDYFAIWSYW